LLINAERTSRHLPAFTGLSAAEDDQALAAAQTDQDPSSQVAGWVERPSTAWGVFEWMYDDAPEGWQHRQELLASFPYPLPLGAACVPATLTGWFPMLSCAWLA
jgi:hypothetical protein